MLHLLNFAFLSFVGDLWRPSWDSLTPVPVIAWQKAKIFSLSTQPDPRVEQIIADYLERLAALGYNPAKQGVWLQSEWAYLSQHRETIPASAASLTKVATSLAAIERWGSDHHFETNFYADSKIEAGILQGNLIVQGGGDPLFVWETGIAVGKALNELGIQEVTGNLVIIGDFYCNFKSDPLITGKLLKLALNETQWSSTIERQYQSLPIKPMRPKVAIAGSVQRANQLPVNARLLLRRQSLPLSEILKQMNIYSNNEMSEILARDVGGADVVADIAAKAANVSTSEIQLINGSGLGVENRISPRAAVNLFIALERQLASTNVNVSDLFPVAGRDRNGTMQWRNIPEGVTVKTGTLAQVSALAGIIPTQERGPVWFAILNYGNNFERFRVEQDRLLQQLASHWQILPNAATPPTTQESYLGDPNRNFYPRAIDQLI